MMRESKVHNLNPNLTPPFLIRGPFPKRALIIFGGAGACRSNPSTEATAWNPTSGVGRSAPYSRTEKVRSVRCSRASLDLGTILGLRQTKNTPTRS